MRRTFLLLPIHKYLNTVKSTLLPKECPHSSSAKRNNSRSTNKLPTYPALSSQTSSTRANSEDNPTTRAIALQKSRTHKRSLAMYRTTEIHEKDLGRLGLTQEDLNAYLTYNYGDEFELEKRKDVYIVSAPGEVELVRFKNAPKILSPWCSPQTNVSPCYTNRVMSQVSREQPLDWPTREPPRQLPTRKPMLEDSEVLSYGLLDLRRQAMKPFATTRINGKAAEW